MNKKRKSWWPLFITNFLSVANDNILKWLVIFIAIYWVDDGNEATVKAVASAMLVLPFILFSPFAGKLAKQFYKRKILLYGKMAEIPIMLIAILGFYLESINIVIFSILLMGVQSMLFSPSKYGLIRDIGGKEGISFGTGAMEMLTFVGVLLGTFAAGVISDKYNVYSDTNFVFFLSFILLTVSVIGLISAYRIKAEESKPIKNNDNLNPLSFFVGAYKFSKNIPGVNNAVFGLSMFWLIGALLQLNISDHGPIVLSLDNTQTSVIMSILAIGIALGAILTGIISKKSVRTALTLIGSIGLSISISLIAIFKMDTIAFTITIFIAAFFAGFYKIPLNSFIQYYVKGRKLGDVLAYLNISVFLFILFASGLYYLLAKISDTNPIFTFGFIAVICWIMSLFFFFIMKGVKEDLISLFKNEKGAQ